MTFDQFALAIFFGGILIHAINTYAEAHQPEEEDEMAYQIEPSACDEDGLLATKLECLKLANAMWRTPESTQIIADQLVADAQKFWDFLVGPAETPDDE